MRFLALAAAIAGATTAHAAPRGFDVRDLVALDRVSGPEASPDGRWIAFDVREADVAANKASHAIWLVGSSGGEARRITAKTATSTSPRFSPDGKGLYFLSSRSGSQQLWRLELAGGEAQQVSRYPLDVGSFKLSPDGRRVAVSLEVFADCKDLVCSKKKLDDRAANKASGQIFDQLFVRHWDTWADGRRSQLFVADFGADGALAEEPKKVSNGIDGDVPSKPFGDDAEYAWSPDGKTIVFGARIAGRTEPWSTNFDLFSVSSDGAGEPKNLTAKNEAWDTDPVFSRDGKTLYYRAMKRPTFEADRFGLMALDLATGASREIDPSWDRSGGSMQLSKDGKSLLVTADDNGRHPLYAVDVANGKVRELAAGGQIDGFAQADGGAIVIARNTLKAPNDLYRVAGGKESRITRFNESRLKDVAMGEPEFFTFKGAGGDSVQGYVVKPSNYEAGKKYPVAFIVHGGPQGAMNDDFHYRWNPQTYAGQGFAVVTINFHGSTGYGQAFTDAISGDWGGKPLEDLKKGWDAALSKYSFLDSSRACALGASYGGYMMFWMAGNWNEPFKCIVAHDGVFDNRMMAYSTEELWFDEWEQKGTQFAKPENYERHNPVNHVAEWKKPILVVHGQLDYRIPMEQGLAAFTAAQRRGVPSKFLYFPDENHWVLKPQNSILWHDTVNAWLKQWAQ